MRSIWCNAHREPGNFVPGHGVTLTDRFGIEPPACEAGNARENLSKELTGSAARVFRLGGEWYFSTREGDIGPFCTREQARREALIHRSVQKSP